MKIKDIYQNKKAVFSFEIFPPNENFSSEKLYSVIDELSTQNPDFISVTYGAGGTTRSGTIEIASYIKNKLNNYAANKEPLQIMHSRQMDFSG